MGNTAPSQYLVWGEQTCVPYWLLPCSSDSEFLYIGVEFILTSPANIALESDTCWGQGL